MAGVNDNLIPAKKGEVRNPKGKPKGTLNLSTHIQNLLNDENFSAWVSDPKVGIREVYGAPMKAIIQALIVKAINGDTKAFDMLGKYGYGSKLDLSSSDGTMTPTVILESVYGAKPKFRTDTPAAEADDMADEGSAESSSV